VTRCIISSVFDPDAAFSAVAAPRHPATFADDGTADLEK
jgi:hypothetical protein